MALSDILKKYGDSTATEGIMFPSAGVQSTSTEQQVYDSTTDGIMTVQANNTLYLHIKDLLLLYNMAEKKQDILVCYVK